MPQIVEPEPRQARFLGQSSPSRPPAFYVPRRVKACDAVIDYSLTAELELGYERGKDEMQRLNGTKAFGPLAKPRKSGKSYVRERDDSFTCSRF